MASIVFLPPHQTQKSAEERKAVQSRIRIHTARHRLQQDARRKQQAAADYWKRVRKDEEDETPVKPKLSQALVKPQTILSKGNSDPFNAASLPITPRLHEILMFYINNFLPTYYDINLVSSPSSQATLAYRHIEAKNDHAGALAMLHDQSVAPGFFLAYGSILADLSSNPEHRMEILRLKGTAVASLQTILKTLQSDSNKTIQAVMLLFQAAVFSGDFAEATMHGRILQNLMYQKAKNEGHQAIDIGHLFQTLWLSLSLAATTSAKPIFDVDEWAPNVFTAVLGSYNISQNPESTTTAPFLDLDSSIKGNLRNIFTNCRRFLWLYWNCPKETAVGGDTDNLFTYLYSDFFIQSSRVVSHLMDVTDGPSGAMSPIDGFTMHVDVIRWHTEHTLTASLLALMSASTGAILNAGKALMMATNLILERLKHVLTPVLKMCLSSRKGRYSASSPSADPRDDLSRATVWALFIGATVEQLRPQHLTPASQTGSWFRDNLTALLKHLQIHDEKEVQGILLRYIYNDDMVADQGFWKQILGSQSAMQGVRHPLSTTLPAYRVPYPSPISDGDLWRTP